jgi:hypothetical protein
LAVKEPKRTSFSFVFILNTEAGLLAWIYDTRPATKQHREESSNGTPAAAISGDADVPFSLLLDDRANELFLSSGVGIDRILTPRLADLSSDGCGQLGFQEAPAPLCPFLKPTCTGDFLDYSESI